MRHGLGFKVVDENGKVVEGDFMIDTDGQLTQFFLVRLHGIEKKKAPDNLTALQFIGKVDSKSEQIAECDVVEDGDFIYVVSWNQEHFGYELIYPMSGTKLNIATRTLTIIGNIYQPEYRKLMPEFRGEEK